MMQCTVCHKPYIGPKNHYVCTYCGASIESPVDLKKDPDHLRDVPVSYTHLRAHET